MRIGVGWVRASVVRSRFLSRSDRATLLCVGCSDHPPLAICVAQFDQRAVWSRQQTQCEGNSFGGERFADWLGRTSHWLQFVIRQSVQAEAPREAVADQ